MPYRRDNWSGRFGGSAMPGLYMGYGGARGPPVGYSNKYCGHGGYSSYGTSPGSIGRRIGEFFTGGSRQPFGGSRGYGMGGGRSLRNQIYYGGDFGRPANPYSNRDYTPSPYASSSGNSWSHWSTQGQRNYH